MSKKTTNLLGIIIAIIAGTYFYITLCSECSSNQENTSADTTIPSTVEKELKKKVYYIRANPQGIERKLILNFDASIGVFKSRLSSKRKTEINFNQLNNNP